MAYNLTVRAGTLRKLITERHGKLVGEVLSEVLVTGLARVGDVIERLTHGPNKHDSPQKGSVNGDAVSEEEEQVEQNSGDKVEAAIYTLLGSGILLPCQTRQFWPEYDLHQEAEMSAKVSKNLYGTTKRERDALAVETGILLRTWRNETLKFVKGAGVTIDRNDQKRGWVPDEEENVSSKRQKTANGVNGTHGHSNNLLPVSLFHPQSCPLQRASAEPFLGQPRTLCQLRKMQCDVTDSSTHSMGRATGRKRHIQSV